MGLDATEGIFAVLYVSITGVTRYYKTTVFFTFITNIICTNKRHNVCETWTELTVGEAMASGRLQPQAGWVAAGCIDTHVSSP